MQKVLSPKYLAYLVACPAIFQYSKGIKCRTHKKRGDQPCHRMNDADNDDFQNNWLHKSLQLRLFLDFEFVRCSWQFRNCQWGLQTHECEEGVRTDEKRTAHQRGYGKKFDARKEGAYYQSFVLQWVVGSQRSLHSGLETAEFRQKCPNVERWWRIEGKACGNELQFCLTAPPRIWLFSKIVTIAPHSWIHRREEREGLPVDFQCQKYSPSSGGVKGLLYSINALKQTIWPFFRYLRMEKGSTNFGPHSH